MMQNLVDSQILIDPKSGKEIQYRDVESLYYKKLKTENVLECPLGCGHKDTIFNLETKHYEECPEALIKCPIEECEDVYLRKGAKDH